MNKHQQCSIHAIQTKVSVIKQIADQEQQHGISQRRKRAIESFYSSVVLHAQKLGLVVPHLGTFYRPEEYVAHCDSILMQIEQKYGAETSAQQDRGNHAWRRKDRDDA